MRKHAILFISLLTAFACVRGETVDTGVKTFDCFTVTVEDSPMTKVHMEDGGAVKWDVGDCIGVYSDMQAPVQYRRGEDGKFYGEKVSGTTFYAFYPYSESSYDEENPMMLHFNVTNEPIMVAKSSSNSLRFYQTQGILHFRLGWDVLSSGISISGRDGEIIPWRGVVSLSTEEPVLQSDDMIQHHTASYCWGSNDGSGIWDYYVFLPPMSFDSGVRVRFEGTSEMDERFEYEKNTKNSIIVRRGEMLTFSLFDLNSEFEYDSDAIELERQSLIALYQALDGANWSGAANWCSDLPVGEWSGITTDPTGRVTAISLSVAELNMTGVLPEEIGNFRKLRNLSISGIGAPLGSKGIYGPLPESLGNLEELRSLYMPYNHFSGGLPDSMRNLKHLEEIDLMGDGDSKLFVEGFYNKDNYLSGPIPEWIGELKDLCSISLQNNLFSGDLPKSLSNLHYLETLDLADNCFTGPLPEVIVKHYFDLRNNLFTGSVPASYSSFLDLEKLYSFFLFNNQLSGPLPVEITSHPRFSEMAWRFLQKQRDAYKIEIDEEHIPATRRVYETLDGGTLDMAAQYPKAEYTMIVRWAEWCAPSRGFIPHVISLYQKYKEKGLQVIWAYAGGEEEARVAFMNETGLIDFDRHIIECYDGSTLNLKTDHLVWSGICFATPFVEVVNKVGNVVFIDDNDKSFLKYSFSYQRSQLEIFLSNRLGGDEYLSTDFSADGTVHTLQTATKGAGVNVVLMGDAFSDRLIADGTYGKVMQKAVDALFSEEPYKSYKDHFNVSYVDVVSKNEVYYGETAINTYYGDGSEVGGDDDKVFEYASKVLSQDEMDDALIIVMMNRDYYAGTCYMYSVPDGDYGRGPSISYFPTSSDAATFDGVVSHEAGGHGFAKLADEYDYPGTISEEEVESYKNMGIYGWWKNADFTSDPTRVKWAKFITDDRYASENIGVFEGACTYQYGAWRPTEESIMRHNIGGFNAPSREAIYYRIHKLAYGSNWEYNYEEFVTWDLAHRTPAATSARSTRTNFVEREFEPLAPPVVVKKDWRELVRNGR